MKHLINKKNEHKTFKTITLFVIVCTFLLGAYREYNISNRINRLETEQWVLNPNTGSIDQMSKKPVTVKTREIEYKHHLKLFYQNMFEFDQYNYKRNLNNASKLINLKDFNRIYAEQQKAEVKKYLEEHDIKTQITIENIDLDMSSYPVKGIIKAYQTQHALDFYKKRRMDARFIIEDLSGRSEQNPHNAVISKFDFTNTKETD